MSCVLHQTVLIVESTINVHNEVTRTCRHHGEGISGLNHVVDHMAARGMHGDVDLAEQIIHDRGAMDIVVPVTQLN